MLDQVAALIREVAATVVLPRFRRLTAADVREKSPGDVVTVADQESERALTAGLTRLLPGSAVVGEEAVAADPEVLRRLDGRGAVWVVDPVDGTANYAAGRTPFAVMVALLRDGVPAAGWIHDPVSGRMTMAEAGGGAYQDGARVTTRADDPGAGALRGVAPRSWFPTDLQDRLASAAGAFEAVTAGHHCAGYEYASVATDEQQFAMFWKVLPWDHVPGALIVREAGGTVRRLNGDEYEPAHSGPGLLVAPNEDVWQTVHRTMFGI